ncbi:MAG: DUF835 domain-containing protein [Candidatus Altiarchaeota archaeon]
MDLTMLWYGSLQLPLNVLTIMVSFAAVVFWIRLFKHIQLAGKQDSGWLWVFGAVLMTLLLNVSTMLLVLANERVTSGLDTVMLVDVNALDFITTATRTILAVTLAAGAYLLLESIKAGGDARFVRTPVLPQAESPSDSEPKYALKPGLSYLVKEGQPNSMKDYYMHADRHIVTGADLFTDLVTHGLMGFAATRRYPPKVRDATGLMKTPMVWLTQEKGFNESVQPGDLAELSHIIKAFINKGGDTVVLLEGLEYLILHNSFDEALRFVQGIDDVVVQNKSRLIVTIDQSAITEQQYHLLSRELTEFNQTIQ